MGDDQFFFSFVIYFAEELVINLYGVTKQYLFSFSCRMVRGLAIVFV